MSVLSILLPLAAGLGVAAIDLGPQSRSAKSVTVDLGAPSVVNFQLGVNRGPACDSGVDYSAGLQAVGATIIRTHDMDAIDWSLNFPYPQMDADPDDPASYNFTAGDRVFDKIVGSGFEAYLRLGNSWGHPSWSANPSNLSTLSIVLLRTVMHYNGDFGGSGGSGGGRQLRYIELWNEPDGGPGPNQFWNRSSSDFVGLVDATAKMLKAYDASLVIGTPAVANALTGTAYSWSLMANLSALQTPFDFFSWHNYGYPGASPSHFFDIAQQVRAQLDSLGLQSVASVVSEWGPCIGDGCASVQNTASAAAFTAAALIGQLNGGVSVSLYYPGCAQSWGLFDQDSTPGAFLFRPLTHAFAFVSKALAAPAMRLETTTEPAEQGYAALATAVNASRLYLVLSAFETTTTGPYNIAVLNAAANGTFSVATYVVDSTHNGTLATNQTLQSNVEGTLSFSGSDSLLPPYTVLVDIRAM